MKSPDEVAAIMRRSVVCDMTLPWFEPYMIDEDVTLPRFKQAGIDFISLTVSMPKNALAATMRHIALVKAHIRARPEMVFAATPEEIVAAKRQGKLALGFHFQGTEPFEGDIELVQSYYD